MKDKTMNDDDDDKEQALVESLVLEAMAGLEHVLTRPQYEAIRAELEMDLRFTEGGRQLLRRLRPDPQVNSSGNVLRDDSGSAMPTDRTRIRGKQSRGK